MNLYYPHNESTIIKYPVSIDYNVGDIVSLRPYSDNNFSHSHYGYILYKEYQELYRPIYAVVPIGLDNIVDIPKDIEIDIDELRDVNNKMCMHMTEYDFIKCYRPGRALYIEGEICYDKDTLTKLFTIGLPYIFEDIHPAGRVYYKIYPADDKPPFLVHEGILANIISGDNITRIIPKWRRFTYVMYKNPTNPVYPLQVFIDKVKYDGTVRYTVHRKSDINFHYWDVPEDEFIEIQNKYPAPPDKSPNGYSVDLYQMHLKQTYIDMTSPYVKYYEPWETEILYPTKDFNPTHTAPWRYGESFHEWY